MAVLQMRCPHLMAMLVGILDRLSLLSLFSLTHEGGVKFSVQSDWPNTTVHVLNAILPQFDSG
jgi:hypothetical protein